jgi:mannose-1-phosphate guanylyltransferase
MILCAGHGTRLRPLTEELPKPLVPVGDRSILAHIVGALRASGIGTIVVNAHHLAEAMLATASDLGLVALREPAILGTAGGVANARETLGEGDLIVVNGDILAELDVAALVRAHVERAPFATLAVTHPRAAGVGTVGLGASGEVVRLRGERFGVEVCGADFVGAQVLSPDARRALPSEGCLVGDLYLPALRRGVRLLGSPTAAGFWDVGTPEAYLACNLDWLARREANSFVAAAPGPESRTPVVSASIPPGVTLERAIVGAGAVVRGTGVLRDVVVWPGAMVEAPLARAIASPRHLVRLENL